MRDKFGRGRRFYFKCEFCGATNCITVEEYAAAAWDRRAERGDVIEDTLRFVTNTFKCLQCGSLWHEPKPRRLPPSYIMVGIPNSLDPYERALQMQALAEAKQRHIQAGCERWKRESLFHKWGFNRLRECLKKRKEKADD